MSASITRNERLVELLAQRATEGLSPTEQVELNGLLAQGEYTDAELFDATAAALTLAAVDDEPMPASLKTRLQLQADRFEPNVSNAQVAALPSKITTRSEAPSGGKLAWFAAAACAVLAIAGWWPRFSVEGDADFAQAREALLTRANVVRRDWKPTEDPAARGVTGDVVWDEQTQVGYMRFRGLPTNDPQQSQYQLWIFDATRGDQYPVDGGVFDVNDAGEVIIPITARLPIRDPALFAVTIEKPGGAVVSLRERIVVVAPVAAG